MSTATCPTCAARHPTDQQIDAGLDVILRASGSALRYYTMPKSRDDMRAALRSVIAEAGRPS